jgi:hypothetical protein
MSARRERSVATRPAAARQNEEDYHSRRRAVHSKRGLSGLNVKVEFIATDEQDGHRLEFLICAHRSSSVAKPL